MCFFAGDSAGGQAMGWAVERSPHLHWGQCGGPGYGLGSGEVTPYAGDSSGRRAHSLGPTGHSAEGSLTSASPNIPPRPDCMSPDLPRRGVTRHPKAQPHAPRAPLWEGRTSFLPLLLRLSFF